MGGGSPAWEVISELRKQYDVQEVTGGEISKDDYDALLVVQPNNLDNEKMDDLIAAIKSGIPTAIFEDPLPLIRAVSPAPMNREETTKEEEVPDNLPRLHLKKVT